MGTRKKKSEDPGAAAAVAEPPAEANGTPAEPTAAAPASPGPVGGAQNRPVKSVAVSAGGDVRVEGSIWPREVTLDGRTVTAYSVTVRKTYRGEDGEYRHTTSFRGSELHLVQYVLGRCSDWILDQRREEDPAF